MSMDVSAAVIHEVGGKWTVESLTLRDPSRVNQAYADMHAGTNLRGVLIHEH